MTSPGSKPAITVTCSNCQRHIPIRGEFFHGRLLNCPHCRADLQVVRTSPPRVELLANAAVDAYGGGFARNQPDDDLKAQAKRKREWLERDSRNQQMQSDSTECPECQSTIRFKKPPHLRQRVECRHCEAMLIVVSRQPLQLDLAYSETRSRPARRKPGRNKGSADRDWD